MLLALAFVKHVNIPMFLVHLLGHFGLVRTRGKCHNLEKSQIEVIVWLCLDNVGRAFRERCKVRLYIRLYVLFNE